METQHADALRSLGDLAAARGYAWQSVDAAAAASSAAPITAAAWAGRTTPGHRRRV